MRLCLFGLFGGGLVESDERCCGRCSGLRGFCFVVDVVMAKKFSFPAFLNQAGVEGMLCRLSGIFLLQGKGERGLGGNLRLLSKHIKSTGAGLPQPSSAVCIWRTRLISSNWLLWVRNSMVCSALTKLFSIPRHHHQFRSRPKPSSYYTRYSNCSLPIQPRVPLSQSNCSSSTNKPQAYRMLQMIASPLRCPGKW